MTDPKDVLDPAVDPHFYQRERAAHLTARYGDASSPWDKDFGGLDLSAQKARQASKELKSVIAANSLDPERPLRFSVRIANRDVALQIVEQDGRWFTNMPIEVSPQIWEWRRFESDTYDNLRVADYTPVARRSKHPRPLAGRRVGVGPPVPFEKEPC